MLPALLDMKTDMKIKLLYAVRSDKDFIYPNILAEMARTHPERIQLYFFAESSEQMTVEGQPVTTGRITKADAQELIREKDVVLLCGPEG
jgi:ferredoxin-NADP reductase